MWSIWMIEKRLICSVHCFSFVLSTVSKLTFQSSVSSFVIFNCTCPNEKKTIFFAFWTLECFNWNLHSSIDIRSSKIKRRGIGVRQHNIHTHFSNLRETSPQVNYNRSIKLIGIFEWSQMTLFFYLLSTARTSHGTNNLKMKVPNIFSIMVWSAYPHRMHHWWRGD